MGYKWIENNKYFYLDDAATTKPCDTAIDAMCSALEYDFGNSNSTHKLGSIAKQSIKDAEDAIKEYLGCPNIRVYFTSGGSEANRIVGRAIDELGFKSVSGFMEHSSNYTDAILYLYDELMPEFISKLPNGSDSALPIWFNHMMVNNETGEVFLDHIKAFKGLVFSDCTQALWEKDLMREAVKYVDIMTVSFHKIHGVKGLGAIIINEDAHKDTFGIGLRIIERYIKTKLKYTQNTPAVATVRVTLEHAMLNHSTSPLQTLLYGLVSQSESVFLGHKMRILQTEMDPQKHTFVDTIRNIRFEGINAEALVRILSELNVFCSSGSACLNGQESVVLREMGVEAPTEWIRISSHNGLKETDVPIVVNKFIEAIEIYEDMYRKED